MVHITAAFIQPGIDNHQALEINNAGPMPLALRPGTRLCQFMFETCLGSARYVGRYREQDAPHSTRRGAGLVGVSERPTRGPVDAAVRAADVSGPSAVAQTVATSLGMLPTRITSSITPGRFRYAATVPIAIVAARSTGKP